MAAEYLVPITATKGQCKGHIVTKIAPLLVDEGGRSATSATLSWRSRQQIEEHTRRAIEEHAGREFDDETWQRIALTQKQVNANPRLKREVITKTDDRYKPAKRYRRSNARRIKQRFSYGWCEVARRPPARAA